MSDRSLLIYTQYERKVYKEGNAKGAKEKREKERDRRNTAETSQSVIRKRKKSPGIVKC